MNNIKTYEMIRAALFECSWYPGRLPIGWDISTWWYSYHSGVVMEGGYETLSQEVVARKPFLHNFRRPLSIEMWVQRTIYHLGNL